MKKVWETMDRWGPGAIAVITLIAVIWYGRFLEGRQVEIDRQLSDRSELELSLRMEIQTWQAHVVTLKQRMIEAGIKNVPDSPKPIVLRKDGKFTITTRR